MFKKWKNVDPSYKNAEKAMYVYSVDLIERMRAIEKQLKQQLEEKGQEINIKNNKLAELKKELTICKDKLKRKTQSNRDLQHRVHNVNTQLAIRELEKVKDYICDCTYIKEPDYTNVRRKIDNQIKELK